MDKQESSSPVTPENLPEMHRVGVRVPPFFPEKPSLWFAQLEAQFSLANITTDATKYYYAIGHLDPVYASEVEDIIECPPIANKYIKLKTELTKRLSASREKRVKQLLMHEELGDRRPSQFYRHLLKLAGPNVPEEFLRTIWTSRLPSGTQSIIASQPKVTMDELVELADRIHDVVTPQVASASTSSTNPFTTGGHNETTTLIAELSKQVEALATKVDRMSRPRQSELSTTYKPKLWLYNGPGAITRVLHKICNTHRVEDWSADTCGGLQVYGREYFYPIHYSNCRVLFEPGVLDESEKNAYTYHLWNKITYNRTIKYESPYMKMAEKYCPMILDMYGDQFRS